MAYTEEEILELTKVAGENIKANILSSIERGVIAEVERQISYVINEQVNIFLKEEIVPEIKKMLLEDKPIIIAASAKAAQEIGNALTDGLIKQAVENLGVSYKRSSIMKALFE